MSDMIANASPTKEFFVYMLTKDIGLSRAILDLVDNCIDGAIRIRNGGRFDGLFINIVVNPDRFHISDNCGGIDIELARKYAFRFGRPTEAVAVSHSIGQFGVGMKRALFKLGNKFSITSKTISNSFILDGNVNEWKDTSDWNFRFLEVNENQNIQIEETSTSIDVTELIDQVRDSFSLDQYLQSLSAEIANAHQSALSRGISISFNGIPLQFHEHELLSSDVLKPVKYTNRITTTGADILVTIIAGLGESEPKDAGWYIYCNGRLVINADRTNITGWGEENGSLIPHFHNRSAAFRGYVFFESDSAAELPWNTTKTGIDIDSRVYKSIRQEMINIMRPIIDVLNTLSKEKEAGSTDIILTPIIQDAKKGPITNISENRLFSIVSTIVPTNSTPRESTISYRKTIEEISLVKRNLKVSSNREVGELTFQYYYNMECE